jgi:hypothetical protein
MARTALFTMLAMLAILTLPAPRLATGSPSQATGTGSAVVEVVTEPELTEGTLRFTGVPAGEVTLAPGQPARLSVTSLSAGAHESILSEVDPAILAAGYQLTGIRCDDGESAEGSTGDVGSSKATFRVDAAETVTCVFELKAGSCICPRKGRWNVQNHAGTMACTGTMSMTLPLKPASGEGTLQVQEGCSTIVASGLSDDEATITMRADGSCGFRGSVGGEEGGFPMTIDFTWVVESAERITGALNSKVSESGMTCEMSRTYELDFH